MKHIIGIAALLAGVAAAPAQATEWVTCATPAGEASFDYLVGTLDVLAIAGLNVGVGEKVWATERGLWSRRARASLVVGRRSRPTEDGADRRRWTRRMSDDHRRSCGCSRPVEGDSDTIYGGTLRIPGYGALAGGP